jgi:hypothetical protein
LAKSRTVALPDYPPSLLKPTDCSEGDVFEQLLDVLAEHYRLDGRFSDLPPPKPGPLPKPGDVLYFRNKELWLWMGLASGLMRDFVPAFGDKKPGPGKPKQKHTQRPPFFPHAHEARLVQIVSALRRILTDGELPSTNTAAYKQLLRILKVSPAPLWRYGKYRKASVFQQAWKDIPKDVRDRPDSYFPLHLPQWDFPKEHHLEVVDAGRGRSILAMQHMAAYLNRESMERLFEILPPVPSALSGS